MSSDPERPACQQSDDLPPATPPVNGTLDQAGSAFWSGFAYVARAGGKVWGSVASAARRTVGTASAIKTILTHIGGIDGGLSGADRREQLAGFRAIVHEFWAHLPPHVSRTSFVYWLFKLWLSGETSPPPTRLDDPVALKTLQTLRYMVRYCSASYGRLAVGFMNRSVSAMVDDDEGHRLERFVSQYTGVCEQDVVHVDAKGGLHRPVHYLCVDRARRVVVVTLRGSMSIADMLTDLNCEPDKFIYKGKEHPVHRGMMLSARSLDVEIRPMVLALLRKYKGFQLRVVGHSLGAGVAALLTSIWRSEQGGDLGHAVCYSFGCPCVCGLDLSRLLVDFVTTVVVGSDIVPRLSLASVHDLRVRVVKRFDGSRSGQTVPMQNLGINHQSQAQSETKPTRKPRLSHPRLFPPGRILWAPARPAQEKTAAEEKRPKASGWCSGKRSNGSQCPGGMRSVMVEEFSEISMAAGMFSSHMPLKYERAVADAEYRAISGMGACEFSNGVEASVLQGLVNTDEIDEKSSDMDVATPPDSKPSPSDPPPQGVGAAQAARRSPSTEESKMASQIAAQSSTLREHQAPPKCQPRLPSHLKMLFGDDDDDEEDCYTAVISARVSERQGRVRPARLKGDPSWLVDTKTKTSVQISTVSCEMSSEMTIELP